MVRICPLRPACLLVVGLGLWPCLAGCGPSTIRVDGVMRQSSEMRPLPSVALGGYQQLRLFVRAAPSQASQFGSSDCGYARLAGTDEGQDRNNAACVPPDTQSTTVGLVRQRLRAYGIHVVRDVSEPHDYEVQVSVTGEAPRAPDRTLAKAAATLVWKLSTEASGGTLMSGVSIDAARAAFASVGKDCSMPGADISGFTSWSRQPMTPDFDVLALASDAVDNLLRCDELARFFVDVRTRFPR